MNDSGDNSINSRLGGANQKRIREVDMLRGLAIILMITGHSFIVHPINIHDVPWCQCKHPTPF